MESAANILLVVLATLTAGLLIFWSVALFQVIRTMLAVPTARAGLVAAARRTLDFDEPIAVSLIALLNFVPGAYEITETLMAAVVPGSNTASKTSVRSA